MQVFAEMIKYRQKKLFQFMNYFTTEIISPQIVSKFENDKAVTLYI